LHQYRVDVAQPRLAARDAKGERLVGGSRRLLLQRIEVAPAPVVEFPHRKIGPVRIIAQPCVRGVGA
jgi:hypothetical protein